MVDDVVARDDLVAEDAPTLVVPRYPVQSRPDQDRDVVSRDALRLQRLENGREQHGVRHRSRDIRYHNACPLRCPDEPRERRPRERSSDRLADGREWIVDRGHHLRREDGRRVRHVRIDPGVAEGKMDLHDPSVQFIAVLDAGARAGALECRKLEMRSGSSKRTAGG
jgi:hypothetical protein